MNSVIFFAYLYLAHFVFRVFTLVTAAMIITVVVLDVVLAVTIKKSFYQMRNGVNNKHIRLVHSDPLRQIL